MERKVAICGHPASAFHLCFWEPVQKETPASLGKGTLGAFVSQARFGIWKDIASQGTRDTTAVLGRQREVTT